MSLSVSLTRVPKRVGFISTRFAGTDGVTLEAAKWAAILEAEGAECFWMAGLLDKPEAVSHLDPLAFFGHPYVLDIQGHLFGTTTRPREISRRVHGMKSRLKNSIYRFIERYELEMLVPQNILAIPMHVPLGLAMTEVMAETGMPTIAHHHDFAWERERFSMTSAGDYLGAAFPPRLPNVEHVVINSLQQRELAQRFGQPAAVIPNVIDFETPAPGIDDYTRDFRAEIGVKDSDVLVLQPTRLVARKGIEHAIELLRRLKMPGLKLIFSHPAGDEGNEYLNLLRERIVDAGIDAVDIWDRVGEARGRTEDGRKIYTLNDVYPHADLVTYPSSYEGFGNAFLEAIYFRKPVVVNSYAVYARDIDPLGFKVIEMSQLVTNEVVEQTREVLGNAAMREKWGDVNFELGRRFFSFSVARRKLAGRIASLFGEG